jgi:UMF1 family MFS transporter
MGYLGSLTTLAIAMPFIQADMVRETFPISAIFFLIFSAPLFLFLRDSRKDVEKRGTYISIGFGRVYHTIKNLKNYKNLALFLLAFFFYIEGVNTVIFFSGNYASTTLNFTMEELIFFFLIVQTTAIVGALLFGILADSIGQKRTIVISLFIWLFTVILAFLTSDPDYKSVEFLTGIFDTTTQKIQSSSFYFVGLLAGSVMGATQSTSRSLMAKLTPFEKKTEFFGFFSFFNKSSAIIGPLAFGLVSYLTGNQGYAILTLTIFFIVGLFILRYVKDN